MLPLLAYAFGILAAASADDHEAELATLWLPLRFAAPTLLATLPVESASKRYEIEAESMRGVYYLDEASTACGFRLTGPKTTRGAAFAIYTCSELSTAPSPSQTAWCTFDALLRCGASS